MDRFIQLINRSNEINNQEFNLNIFETLLETVNINIDQNINDNDITCPAKKEFVDGLEKINNVNTDLICSICLDKININEECIKLPCKDHPHFFHEGNENCPGIMKWLKKSNTCPVCRTGFPKEETQINVDQSMGGIIIQRYPLVEGGQEQGGNQGQGQGVDQEGGQGQDGNQGQGQGVDQGGADPEILINNTDNMLNQFIDIILIREEEMQIEYAIQTSILEQENIE